MGIAAAAGSAQIKGDRSSYLEPGMYGLLQVTALKGIDKPGTLAFIAEHDVLVASPDAHNPPGSSGSIYIDCLKFQGGLAGDVRKYLGALNKMNAHDVDGNGIEIAISAQQPCVGMFISIQAHHKPKKSKPDEHVTVYKFMPADPQLEAQGAQIRQQLGLPAIELVHQNARMQAAQPPPVPVQPAQPAYVQPGQQQIPGYVVQPPAPMQPGYQVQPAAPPMQPGQPAYAQQPAVAAPAPQPGYPVPQQPAYVQPGQPQPVVAQPPAVTGWGPNPADDGEVPF